MSEPTTFRLSAASESFLDWIDEGGVPMPDTRFDTAMMLRKIEAESHADADAQIARLRAIVDEQAEDAGLWFDARTAPEGYLQQELRRLHAAIEAIDSTPAQDYGLRAEIEKPWREALADTALHYHAEAGHHRALVYCDRIVCTNATSLLSEGEAG